MVKAVSRRLFVGGTIATGTLALAACQQNNSALPPEMLTPAPAKTRVEGFTMAVSGVIAGLDPLLMNTSEQTLLCRQIFQRLVGVDPNTGAPTPTELAVDWHVSNDGLTYTFTLNNNIEFHDGTICDADAVVTNVQRWALLPELINNFAELGLPDYFGDVFGHDETTVEVGRGAFHSVEALAERIVVINLRKPVPSLLPALAHTAFGICSPTALDSKTANTLDSTINGLPVSRFGLEPIGTGPYTAQHHADSVELKEFHGAHATASPEPQTQVNFAPAQAAMVWIKQDFARLRLLQQGELSAMADLTPDQLQAVMQQGLRFIQRDPFGMAYLGINHGHDQLKSEEVRRLLSIALDKNHLAGSYFISGTNATQAFTPPALAVPTNHIPNTIFEANEALELAEELLESEPALQDPIPLYFPTDAARTWLPLPERTAMDITAQYATIGVKIRPVPLPWNKNYLRRVHQDDSVGLYLWGHVGAYRDPLEFLVPIVHGRGPAREFSHNRAVSLLQEARHEEDRSARQQIFAEISGILANNIATIPLCAPLSALALAQEILEYPTSPVLDEPFSNIRINV